MPAIVRVGWVIDHDARRMADWVNENPCVEVVAIDWCTYRSPSDWAAQLAGLAVFDARTGRRIRYLINGPRTSARFSDVYRVLQSDRVCFTNATFPPPPEKTPQQRPMLPDPSGPERVRAFRRRVQQQNRSVQRSLAEAQLRMKVNEGLFAEIERPKTQPDRLKQQRP